MCELCKKYRIALENIDALKASEARVKELEAKLAGRELSDDELYNISS